MAPIRLLAIRPPRAWIVLLLLAAGGGIWWMSRPSAEGVATRALAPSTASASLAAATAIAGPADTAPETANKSVAPTLAEVVRKAFRASPSQRAADRQRMQDASDYSVLAEEFLGRAKAGDADAAQALADMLNRCAAAYLYGSRDYAMDLQSIALHPGLEEDAQLRFDAEFVAEQRRCGTLVQTDPEALDDAAMAMTRLARELGAPDGALGRLLTTARGDPARADEFRRLAIEALVEGGSQALARHAVLLGGLSGLRQEAFALAACWLNPACADDLARYAVDHDPVGQLAMTTGNYLILLAQSPRDQLITETQARDILRLWHARRFADLLVPISPQPPSAP